MTILQFRQRCAAVRFFLVNIAAGCSKTSSPAGMAVKLRCSVVHKIGLPPAVSQPASISLSRSWGISWGNLLAKKKRFASSPRDKAFTNTLRYHSSCRPLAGSGPSLPAVTGRCCNGHHTSTLTHASSFSRRLQGDFPPPSLAALHRPAALLAGPAGILVLIHAI